jgi:putative toxin-antitoxin system antitoxin component (TIGR02293 family)
MVNAEAILATLGQKRGKKGQAADAARDLVRQGMPASALDRLADQLGVPLSEIQRIVGIPPATAARKRAANETLKPALSDRAFRIARMLTLATDVFESREKAAHWMREPNRALHGEVPLHLLDTEIGSREVEQILERIEHGVYS